LRYVNISIHEKIYFIHPGFHCEATGAMRLHFIMPTLQQRLYPSGRREPESIFRNSLSVFISLHEERKLSFQCYPSLEAEVQSL